MKKMICVLVSLFTMIIHSQTIKTPLGKTIPNKVIDSFISSAMKETNTPGVSMAIINNGEIVYHGLKGFSRPNKKVTEETIFEAASLSKPLFGYFAMKFVEEGLLDLDKPLYKYFPYKDIAHDERYKSITARMVLSHKTGFPNWRTDTPGDSLFIDFTPGTKFQYSGEGYQYLALVLQHLLKTDAKGLQKIFHSKVAQPLGLKVTRYIPNKENQKNKAQAFKNGKWMPLYNQGEDVFGAAYGINSNAADFSKWIIALMNEEGLSKSSYAELFKNQTTLPQELDITKLGITAITLGFYAGDYPMGRVYGHGGNNGKRFTCMFYFIPEIKWGAVLFTNSGYGEDIGLKFFQFLMS